MAHPSRPRQPVAPPASPEAGAALVREFVVKLYDQQNGKGVEWETIAAALFRASFDALREMQPPRKQAYASRVHQRAYEVMTDDPAPGNSEPAAAGPSSSNTGSYKSPHPKPPR